MTGRLKVIVAGGGVGGLATAAGLARCGHDVTVVERARGFSDAGSGMVLYPNGVAAADAISGRLGLRIRSAGHVAGPGEVRKILSASGRLLASEPIGRLVLGYHTPQVFILRTALQQALLDEAAATGALVRFGVMVNDYAADATSVRVGLSDGSTQHADLLVAADGIKSAIRRRMLDDGPPQYRGYTSVRGRTAAGWLPAEPFVVNGRGVQLFVAPVATDTLYWTAKISAPAGVWTRLGPADALRALTRVLAGWPEPVVRLITAARERDVAVTDICDRDPVPRWVDGRAVLLGDAAHPMTPALGQAANMALEDAAVLASALCPAGADVGAALLAYQRERTERTAPVVLRSRRQGALDQGAGRLRSLARDAVMRLRGRKDAAFFEVTHWTAPQLSQAA